MYKTGDLIVLVLYVIAIYITLPVIVAWGWVRWVKHIQPPSVSAVLSLIGFTFATLSCLLAISFALYARAIGGFPYYDALLMKVYGWGGLLSLAGLGFGIGGIWRRSTLRWHAPACAAGMLLFWFFTAASE